MKKVVLVTIMMPFLASSTAFSQAGTGDVIITEIMADPSPVNGLPDAEYIEICNRSSLPVNLDKWKFESAVFPAILISAGEYLILCRQSDTALFRNYGRVEGLKSFPAVTDGGKILGLYDNSGKLIHGVEYSSGWYGNSLKDGGGWSLEMIDPSFPFYFEGNWKASVSVSGGTPGMPNSVAGNNPDKDFTGIMNVFPADSLQIEVTFSEPLLDETFDLNNCSIDGNNVTGIAATDPLSREFVITLEKKLVTSRIVKIVFSELSDFAGNAAIMNSFEFGLAENASQGDIVFNEILFNPWPGYPDYLEFVNVSGKILDASRLQLASVNDETRDTSHLYLLSEVGRCILPGKFYAVTTDIRRTIEKYDLAATDALFEVGSLPSMSDDAGHLLLLNMKLDKIDEVKYDEEMHYSLLSGYEGISLEKVSPVMSSSEPSNWHSAAGTSGWGTPGAVNSVYDEAPEDVGGVSLSSKRLSPDSDGFEDLLTIHLDLKGMTNVVTASVFDETGSFIRKICNNLSAGPGSAIIWDGTAGDGTAVRPGIYVILVTWFNDTGKTGRWKGVCAVVR